MERSVPFKIKNLDFGLSEVNGLLKNTEQGLAFEFKKTDVFPNSNKSNLKNVEIPFGKIKSLEFKKGFWNAKIIIEGRSMKALENLPGVEVATCTLQIERKDKKEAEKLVSKTKMDLSEYKLKEMED